jgi:arginase
MQTRVNLIGYASGIGANDMSCAQGPLQLQQTHAYKRLQKHKLFFQWHAMLKPSIAKQNDIASIAEINKRLAKYTQKLVCDQLRFVVIGGDHSCAIGTWSGTQAAIQTHGKLGLIWIDAHMGSHTPATTLSGNVHGMPLACLLGYGEHALTSICHTQAKLLPENICLIGTRSFEPGEAELLAKLKVRIYDMEEITQRGLDTVLIEARELVSKNTVGYGISIDLDALDPQDAPGVSSPALAGIRAKDLLQGLTSFKQDKNLLGIELSEYAPTYDVAHKTATLCCQIIETFFTDAES